jgi:hypothetical protein
VRAHEESRRSFLLNLASTGAALVATGALAATNAARSRGRAVAVDSGSFLPLAATPTIRLRPAYLKSGPANVAWQWLDPPPEITITGNNVKVRVLMASETTGRPMPGVRCWLDKRRYQSSDAFYPYDSAHAGPDGYAYFLPIYLSPGITWEFRYWAEGAQPVKRLVRV